MTHDLTDKGMREILRQVIAADCVKDYPESPSCTWPDCLCRGEVLQPRLALDAMTRIRDAAYEEAAKVADGHVQFGIGASACKNIADDIRSLSKPLEKENG